MAVNQLKVGALLSYVVLILNNIVSLAYTPFMLRMMGQSEYGLYSLVASVIAYLTILDFGFGNAIIRYTSQFRAQGKLDEQFSMFGMFIILYSIIGIIALIAGLCLYYNVDAMFSKTMTIEELNKAKIMMLLMVFNIVFTFPLSIFGAIITAYENFIFQRIIQIVRIILNTAVMILLLTIGYKAIALVVVATVFNLMTLLINYLYCKYKIKIKIHYKKVDWSFLKEVALYSFYIFLSMIMDRIYWGTGQFILGVYVGTAAIAIFAIAISLQNMYMSLSASIANVFLPKITKMITEGQSEKTISDLFIKTGRVQFIIISFVLVGFIIFGQQFVVLWAGKSYSDSYMIALLFFIPLTVPLIQTVGITILQARNQMKFRSLLYIGIAFCSLGLQFLLAKKYGGIGVAIGISSGLFLGQIIIMNIYYYKKQKIDIPYFWKEIAKMSIVPLVLGMSAYYLSTLFVINTIMDLISGIVLFSIVYIPLFWIFSMNKFEKDLFGEPLKKLFLRR